MGIRDCAIVNIGGDVNGLIVKPFIVNNFGLISYAAIVWFLTHGSFGFLYGDCSISYM